MSAADRDGEMLRVLIAEDDATTRMLLTALVSRLGHSVRSAADGAAAWSAADTEPFDLIIADWSMPNMDGLELCRLARARCDDRCFIMMITARDGTGDLQAALEAGADDYMVKPVQPDQLRARLVIAQRRLELSRARRAAEEQAASMRWLAGIGQTVLTLQHEINNPLTALYGFLDGLLSSRALPAVLREDVARAQAQAQRITRVITKLSALKSPSTVELIPGLPMLALPSESEFHEEHAASLPVSTR